MKFDIEGLKALTWFYAQREGVITPDTWEKIISKSTGGEHIPGDVYMSDGKVDTFGQNDKSVLKKFTKGNKQTISFVQCRCPLDESSNIGEGVIKTLVDKREESFKEFGLNKMMDVIIVHNRDGEDYNVRVFCYEQPKYEEIEYEWHGGHAYVNPDKSKNGWEKDWKIKRVSGDDSAFQTCVLIKKTFDKSDAIADFTVKCYDNYDVDMEEAKREYAKVQQK